MSAALTGKPHNWRSGSTNPKVAKKIQQWWTPERREAKRQELLKRNPDAIYHGLSCRGAAKIRKKIGQCQRCGSPKRLHIHHKDRNKKNQETTNLEVLCLICHRLEHRGEKRKRKTLVV
jgi:5-methylcytosine-specific restriction endonuclease McrA